MPQRSLTTIAPALTAAFSWFKPTATNNLVASSIAFPGTSVVF